MVEKIWSVLQYLKICFWLGKLKFNLFVIIVLQMMRSFKMFKNLFQLSVNTLAFLFLVMKMAQYASGMHRPPAFGLYISLAQLQFLVFKTMLKMATVQRMKNGHHLERWEHDLMI